MITRIRNFFGFKRVAKEMEAYYWQHPLECMSSDDLFVMIDSLDDKSFARLDKLVRSSRYRRTKK